MDVPLEGNTTQALIADLDALRTHLGIERWLLHGVSWGSTLALAAALEHPEHVLGLVLMAVTTGSREEVDWITRDIGRVFPEAWERFAAAAKPGERIVDAYVRLLGDEDSEVRRAAAESWSAWEATHISLDPRFMGVAPTPQHDETFARLVSWYWANDCFLVGDDRILPRAHRLEGIPGVLIHGRRDISGPADTAWRLHRAWPGSRIEIVEDEGHGGPRMVELATEAIGRLGR